MVWVCVQCEKEVWQCPLVVRTPTGAISGGGFQWLHVVDGSELCKRPTEGGPLTPLVKQVPDDPRFYMGRKQ